MKKVFPIHDQHYTWRAKVEIKIKVIGVINPNRGMIGWNLEIPKIPNIRRVRKISNVGIVIRAKICAPITHIWYDLCTIRHSNHLTLPKSMLWP